MQPKVIKSFINPTTAKYLNDYLNNAAQTNARGLENIYVSNDLSEYDDNYLLNKLNKDNLEESIIYDLFNLIFQSAAKEFDLGDAELSLERSNFLVFKEGQSKDYHLDQYGEGDLYTAILYLNDEYQGGDIIFYDGEWGTKDLPTTYCPKPGMLVSFKGDHTYPHEVTEITHGTRTNMTMNFRAKRKGQ
jgi:predicted 2-oxoglutarate/Fe(II)-dependent dioxygenase YbiX